MSGRGNTPTYTMTINRFNRSYPLNVIYHLSCQRVQLLNWTKTEPYIRNNSYLRSHFSLPHAVKRLNQSYPLTVIHHLSCQKVQLLSRSARDHTSVYLMTVKVFKQSYPLTVIYPLNHQKVRPLWMNGWTYMNIYLRKCQKDRHAPSSLRHQSSPDHSLNQIEDDSNSLPTVLPWSRKLEKLRTSSTWGR